MAHLDEMFKRALANIEPEANDVSNASIAHEEIRAVLGADDALKAMEIDTRLIGSYGRHVSIRRINDVDVFSMLNSGTVDEDPKRLVDYVVEVLESAYGDRVEAQNRSVKVDFPDFGLSVDAVPARPISDHWEIPDKPGGWEETNPLKLGELTTEMNNEHEVAEKGIYVPTVKLVRQVRRARGIDKPGGLYFEILTLHAFQTGNLEAASRAEYLTLALEEAARVMLGALTSGLSDPTLPGQIIKTSATPAQLQTASARLTESARLAREAFEDEDDCASAKLWRDLLGRGPDGEFVFTMPAHCEPDGSRKAVTIQAGSHRVPSGNDRFA